MKKITAIILAMALLVTCLPVAVFADDVQPEPQTPSETNEVIDVQEFLDRYSDLLDGAQKQYAILKEKVDALAAQLISFATGFIANVSERIGDPEENFNNFRDESMEKLEGFLNLLNEYIAKEEAMAEEFSENPAIAGAIKELQDVTERLKAAVVLLKEATFGLVEKAKASVSAAVVKANALIADAEAAAQVLIAKAQERAEEIKAAAETAAEALREKAAALMEADKEKAAELAAEAAEKLEAAKEKAAALVAQAQETAALLISKSKEAAAEWIVQAKDKAAETIANAKEAALVFIENAPELFELLKAQVADAITNLKTKAEESAIADALKAFIAKAQAWAKNEGLDPESIMELVRESEELQSILKAYEEAGTPAALKELTEQAKAVFLNNAGKIAGIIKGEIAVLNNISDKVIAPILKRFGTSKEDIEKKLESVKRLIEDIIAYGIGLATGQSYTNLVERAFAAEAETTALQIETELAKLENTTLTAALAYETTKNTADAAVYKNTIKVLNGKPAIKKVVTKAGKKFAVKWKAIKKATINFYQVAIGNQFVKVNAKTLKLTHQNKAVKKILKQIKPGTKVKVTVRAAYKVGKKTYYSRWAKASKVVIK